MPKHLRLSADDSQHWYLPDDSDLEQVRLGVKNAVQCDEPTIITVEISSGVTAPLLVNGKTLTICAVYETPPPYVGGF